MIIDWGTTAAIVGTLSPFLAGLGAYLRSAISNAAKDQRLALSEAKAEIISLVASNHPTREIYDAHRESIEKRLAILESRVRSRRSGDES